jgi:hypothetical protein
MNLYELTQEFDELLKRVEAESINADADENEVLQDMLSDAGMALDDKVDNIIGYIKNLTADAEAIKKEELALASRRKAKENKVKSLKNYLLYAGIEKYESSRGVIKCTPSKAVEIDDLDIVPIEWCNIKETVTPDKAKIKKALIAGEEIKGATLVERKNIGVK